MKKKAWNKWNEWYLMFSQKPKHLLIMLHCFGGTFSLQTHEPDTKLVCPQTTRTYNARVNGLIVCAIDWKPNDPVLIGHYSHALFTDL